MRVEVLRLGHRPGRDPRLTTHLALAARAFGASAMHVQPRDPALEQTIQAVVQRFGGPFTIDGVERWREFLRGWEGISLHLTMYGEDLDEVLPSLPRDLPVLVVVGGPKVPAEVYRLATRNVAVTHQPHSEVAALALTLDRLLGTPRVAELPGARVQVLPSDRGKNVRTIAPTVHDEGTDRGGGSGPARAHRVRRRATDRAPAKK